jgi:hypothetical protein
VRPKPRLGERLVSLSGVLLGSGGATLTFGPIFFGGPFPFGCPSAPHRRLAWLKWPLNWAARLERLLIGARDAWTRYGRRTGGAASVTNMGRSTDNPQTDEGAA